MLSIISTVGTTVFGGFGTVLSNEVKKLSDSRQWTSADIAKIVSEKAFPGDDIYGQALADLDAKQTPEFLRRACAEINAIEGIHADHNIHRGNSYYFLATDTFQGVLAARVLADFCRECYEVNSAEVLRVEGLQVQDERAFRLLGLPSLIQTIYRILDDTANARMTAILNPTGGFKAAIPYMTLVGMIRGVKVALIHETSQSLITLAGLPITLDLEKIAQYRELLEIFDSEVAQQDGVGSDQLREALKLSRTDSIEQHPLWSLFERYESNHYILSGIGYIAREELRKRASRKRIYLSKQAAERLDSLDRTNQTSFERYFARLHEPGWIDSHRHDEVHNDGDAVAIKPGNVDERFFIYLEGDSILIAELAYHQTNGSYDRTPRPVSYTHLTLPTKA
jgi:putative CRISPR-associated protein (TIGR02619 family)